MEYIQDQSATNVEYMPNVSIPEPLFIDPEWDALIDVNQLTSPKSKSCIFFYGDLADRLYMLIRENCKEKTIKLETIDLTELSIHAVDGEFIFCHTVEYTFLSSDQPLPTDTNEMLTFQAYRQTWDDSIRT